MKKHSSLVVVRSIFVDEEPCRLIAPAVGFVHLVEVWTSKKAELKEEWALLP